MKESTFSFVLQWLFARTEYLSKLIWTQIKDENIKFDLILTFVIKLLFVRQFNNKHRQRIRSALQQFHLHLLPHHWHRLPQIKSTMNQIPKKLLKKKREKSKMKKGQKQSPRKRIRFALRVSSSATGSNWSWWDTNCGENFTNSEQKWSSPRPAGRP